MAIRANTFTPTSVIYGTGVNNTTELANITKENRFDKQLRYVEDTKIIYGYNEQASSGDVQPVDSNGTGIGEGNGRWVKVGSGFSGQHNDLPGLNDGDYKHLTALEYANIALINVSNTFTQNQSINGSTIGDQGVNIPSGKTFNINGSPHTHSYENPLTFTATDFDRAVDTISIDYTNGQKATAGQPGFLTAADRSTFNGKQPAGTYSTDIHSNITDLNAVSGTNTGDNATNSQYSGLATSKEDVLTIVYKTANYSAQPNELVSCDVSAGSFNVTLPSSPADKTRIVVKLDTIGPMTSDYQVTLKASGTDKFNEPTGNVDIYLYLFGTFAECQYSSSTGLWHTFISAGTTNFANNFPGIDATTPITNANITINTTTRVLTITPPLGYFNIFVDGVGKTKRFRKTGTVNFPAFTDTSGEWFFYFDVNGTAVSTQTPWTGSDFASLAPLYRLIWNKELFTFTVTAATATLGDTYTNNGSTFTVLETIAGGTTLKTKRTTGTNNPTASGNLVRATGAGTDPIVFSTFTESPKAVAQYIEYHLNDIPAETHRRQHKYGAIWMNGFSDADNALATGTPNTDGRNTVISLSTGTNSDENLSYTVTNDSTPTNPWEQDLGELTPASLNATNSGLFSIFTQDSGGLISFLPATRFPFAWDVATNRPQIITSTGTRTLVNDNRWFVYFIYATQNPRVGEAIKLVSAPTEYTSLINAQAVTWTNIQNTYQILGNDGEIRPLYRVIFYNDNALGGAFPVGCKYSVIREVQDLRKAQVTSTTTASGSIPASSVTVVPAGNISSTNVQAGLEELDLEKLSTAGGTLTGALNIEHASGIFLGKDETAGTPNIAGYIKMMSAGDNAFYNTFTSGTNTANATYTLPTAMPGVSGYALTCTDAGVMSWSAMAGFAWGANITSTSGTGATITIADSSSSGTIGTSTVIGNTQTLALVANKTDLGTSAYAHTGYLVNAFNVSATCYAYKADMGTTGTGKGFYATSSGASNAAWLYYGSVTGTNKYGYRFNGDPSNPTSNYFLYGTCGGGNANDRIVYSNGDYGLNVEFKSPSSYKVGLYVTTSASFPFPGACYGVQIANVMSSSSHTDGVCFKANIHSATQATSNALGKFIEFSDSVSGTTLNSRTIDPNTITFSRTSTSTSSTISDNYNLFSISRTNIMNGVGGTFNSTGSVFKISNIATQTNGTLADSTDVLLLSQSVNSTGNLINAGTGSFVVTNKGAIKQRVITTTDDATAVIDVAITDVYELSAVANATEFTLTGTPINGQKLLIRIKDAGVAKGLTWTGFTAIGITLPTTTVASKRHYVGCVYNLAATARHAIAYSVEA